MSKRIPFKCYNREFELEHGFRLQNTAIDFHIHQTNWTKISLANDTFTIKQSLTYKWDGKAPKTTCKIECQEATGTLASTFKDEEHRCEEAYKTDAGSFIENHCVWNDPQPIAKYLTNASEDDLGKAFENALAFIKKADVSQASTTQGEAA